MDTCRSTSRGASRPVAVKLLLQSHGTRPDFGPIAGQTDLWPQARYNPGYSLALAAHAWWTASAAGRRESNESVNAREKGKGRLANRNVSAGRRQSKDSSVEVETPLHNP